MQLCPVVWASAICFLPVSASENITALEVDKAFRAQSDREIRAEADPTDQQWCALKGQITLTYASGENGLPNVGLLITDPRGRKIGYDPLADKGWEELPLAQGFLDCEENEDTGELRHCSGRIQICGPVSGTYRLEILPKRSGKFSLSVSGSSEQTWEEPGFHSSRSQVELESETQKRTPTTLLLKYSREIGEQIKLTESDQRVTRKEKSAKSKTAKSKTIKSTNVKPKTAGLRDVTATKSAAGASQ